MINFIERVEKGVQKAEITKHFFNFNAAPDTAPMTSPTSNMSTYRTNHRDPLASPKATQVKEKFGTE